MTIFKDEMYPQIVCWYSLLTIPYWISSSVNWVFTHIWMPEPWQCKPCEFLLNRIQPYSHLDCGGEDRRHKTSRSCRSNWKRSLSNLTNNENITYEYIAYRTQKSILFCCTETNNILRASSSSEHAVFSMRTFTWSWWFPDSLFRAAMGLNVESYGLRLGARLTSTCLRSRHLRVVERHTRTMVF